MGSPLHAIYDAAPTANENTISSGSSTKKGDAAPNTIGAPARKTAEGAAAGVVGVDPSNQSSTSKKAREVLVTVEGEVIANDDDSVVIKQPKRTPTDHVATLGYKIKETHVNIDTPVLEGSGENLPYERDITFSNISNNEGDIGEGQPLLRDQSNPTGQHLLVDIKNLEAAFLNSESRLADAMQASVKAAGLTMLSYHCHSLHPAGVSCVGVLLESHIS
ncbi:hypothetical protein ACHAXR_001065, partial [Thalassiosira sp. AJA248-18]